MKTKKIYFLVSGAKDLSRGDDGAMMFEKISEAIKFAKECGRTQIEAIRLTKDAPVRLYNGGGGFVEDSHVVWTPIANKSQIKYHIELFMDKIN